jgi:putative membrane protein
MGAGSGMGWMWMFWLLLVVGIVLVVVVAVRALGGGIRRDGTAGGSGGRPSRSRAREVLDERYARGELTTEKYRERLTTLGEDA